MDNFDGGYLHLDMLFSLILLNCTEEEKHIFFLRKDKSEIFILLITDKFIQNLSCTIKDGVIVRYKKI